MLNKIALNAARIAQRGSTDKQMSEVRIEKIMASDVELLCRSLCKSILRGSEEAEVFPPFLKDSKSPPAAAADCGKRIGIIQNLKNSAEHLRPWSGLRLEQSARAP